jgi:hypothetical protein
MFPKDFREFVELLKKNKAEYLIIGGSTFSFAIKNIFGNFAGMKKALPFLMFLLLNNFGGECFGQPFYISSGIGGAISLAPSSNELGASYGQGNSSGGSLNTMGGGLNILCSFGYFIDKHIDLGLGISYSNTSGNSWSVGSPYDPSRYDNISSHLLILIPSFKITGDTSKTFFYLKFGMPIGIIGNITRVDEYIAHDYSGNPTDDFITTIRYNGNFSSGILISLGWDIKINQRLSLLPELSLIYENWIPANTQIINNSDNGIPILTNPNLPTFGNSYSINSLGINVGLKYKFGKIKQETK